MAYASVTSLIQTLEYLVKFPCVVLEIRIIQAKTFSKEVDQLIEGSELDNDLYSLQAALERLRYRLTKQHGLRTYDYDLEPARIELPISEPLVLGFFLCRASDMEEFKENTLEEINSSQKKLNEFLDKRRDMLINRFRWLYSQLTTEQNWGCDELKQDMTFCCEVAKETTLLWQELQHLLTFLDSPSNTNGHDHIVEHIRDVAYEPRNFVDICMVDNHIEHLYALFESRPDEVEIFGQSLVNRIKSIFLEKGIRERLLLNLKKIRSIREEIKSLTLEDLQLGSTSLDASSHGNSNQEDVVVGLDDDICSIIEKLTRPPPLRLEILTIVGMGGIGKTTLARKVFDHKSIVLQFHCRAWVTVSQVYEVKNLFFSIPSL